MAWRERHPRPIGPGLAAMVATGLAMNAEPLPPLSHGIERGLYTTGGIGLVTLATRSRSPGPGASFPSEASLGLCLFHHIFGA